MIFQRMCCQGLTLKRIHIAMYSFGISDSSDLNNEGENTFTLLCAQFVFDGLTKFKGDFRSFLLSNVCLLSVVSLLVSRQCRQSGMRCCHSWRLVTVGAVFDQSLAVPNCPCCCLFLSLTAEEDLNYITSDWNCSPQVSTLIATALVEYSLPLPLGRIDKLWVWRCVSFPAMISAWRLCYTGNQQEMSFGKRDTSSWFSFIPQNFKLSIIFLYYVPLDFRYSFLSLVFSACLEVCFLSSLGCSSLCSLIWCEQVAPLDEWRALPGGWRGHISFYSLKNPRFKTRKQRRMGGLRACSKERHVGSKKGR